MNYKVVKYNNWLNELNFKSFTSMDSNFLFAICAAMKEREISEVEFTFDDLRKAVSYNRNGDDRLISDLRRMNRKMLSIQAEIETSPGEYYAFNLFDEFHISVKKKSLTVSVNPKYAFVLNGLVKNYTKFELESFLKLSSKYAKALFRQLKQWRTTGSVTMKVEELRNMLGGPASYPVGLWYNKILSPAVNDIIEAGCFDDFRCTVNHERRRGRPVSSYTFSWKPEKTEQKPPKKQKNRFLNIEQSDVDYDKIAQEKVAKRWASEKNPLEHYECDGQITMNLESENT